MPNNIINNNNNLLQFCVEAKNRCPWLPKHDRCLLLLLFYKTYYYDYYYNI